MDSQVLIFRTLFSLKWGNFDFLALLKDVKCEKNFAYKNRCLYVRSATVSRKKNMSDKQNRSIKVVTTIYRSLQRITFINKSIINKICIIYAVLNAYQLTGAKEASTMVKNAARYCLYIYSGGSFTVMAKVGKGLSSVKLLSNL